MTTEEKIALLEEDLELDEGTLRPDMKLSEIEEWDSMAYLNFVVLVDDNFGSKVSSTEIKACKVVDDLLKLMK